jgi:hypothetical protein
MSTLNTCHTPPPNGPELLIVRLKAGKKLLCVILSQSLWGVWTHWNGARSEPCFQERAHCNGCKRGLPKRWKGYLHVWDLERRRQVFVELTPVAAESINSQVGLGSVLRGYRVTLERMKGDQSRLIVHVHPMHTDSDTLPPAKDPAGTLTKLWGTDRQIPLDDGTSDLAPAA